MLSIINNGLNGTWPYPALPTDLNWLHQTTVPTIQSGRSKDFMGSFSSFNVLLISTWFSIPRGITHLHILWASIPSLKKLTIASVTLELGLLIMHKIHIPTYIIRPKINVTLWITWRPSFQNIIQNDQNNIDYHKVKSKAWNPLRCITLLIYIVYFKTIE